MTNHDSTMKTQAMFQEMLKSMPEFNDMAIDMQVIKEHSDDPFFLAVLLYRTAKEKENQNKLLESMNDKYDQIMLHLKSQSASENISEKKNEFTILPEQDEKIIQLVESKGQITAEIVKDAMGYKGLNAASQRLNKLFREGHLKKLRAGKKVVYIAGI